MSKPAINPVQFGPCRLRLAEKADIEQIRVWRNQPEIRKWFLCKDVITVDDQKRWWRSYQGCDDDLYFVVEETDEGLGPVGVAALYDIACGRAEFGRLMIGETTAQGRGLAQAAVTAALTIAFAQLDLDEVFLKVYPDNEPAIAVYKTCGFKETGVEDGMVHMIRHKT